MKKHLRLIFPRHLIKEPVIFTMAKKYDVMPNIRQAKVTETRGEMVLSLDGEEENLRSALRSLEVLGIAVELLVEDNIE